LQSVFFTSSNVGFISGSSNAIFRTTNAGQNWELKTTPVSGYMNSLYFVDNNIGFAVGTSGKVMNTTDGGLTWLVLPLNSQSDLNDVSFIDANVGCIVGASGIIYRTTDGGTNWENISFAPISELQSIQFKDDGIGLAVGFGGAVARTTDEGSTWSVQQFTRINFLGLHFPGNDTGYVVGSSGSILKTIDGGTLVSGIKPGNEQLTVNDFTLSQNYPNPFNPITNIEFRIVNSGFVSLKVYDILGNEVASLVNEELTTGEYKVEFNGKGLSSGIYFYQLKTNNFIETRKMVMLK
ncbi:MAG: YCF48-related protein, partial [Ignavibacteriaceae bacterium]|nr:YCF48-related protein [Ignavibacteriaceae bacterium]